MFARDRRSVEAAKVARQVVIAMSWAEVWATG